MPLVVSDAGELVLLEACFKDSSPSALTLKLFTNDITPDSESVVGDFTEATFSGYSATTLTRSNFGSATTNASNKGQIAYPQITITSSGGSETVYGYYIVLDSTLVMAERFSQARLMTSGDQLVITPTFTLASEN